MAIVTKAASSAPKWEEFVTIKLSKREAAGLLALIGPTPNASLVTYKLYDELDDVVGGDTQYGDMRMDMEECKRVSRFIDSIYGNL